MNVMKFREMVVRRLSGPGSIAFDVIKMGEGVFDPATGRVEGAEETFEYNGFRTGIKTIHKHNSMIVDEDILIYASPVLANGDEAPDPEVGDGVKYVEDIYTIKRVIPWNFNGLSVGWKVFAAVST